MTAQKRKRPHDDSATAASQPQTDAPARRTTRHTVASAPEPEKQLRSGRVRASTIEISISSKKSAAVPQGKSNDASKPENTSTVPPPTDPPKRKRGRPANPKPDPIPVVPKDDEKKKDEDEDVVMQEPVQEKEAQVQPQEPAKGKENIRPASARPKETAIPPPRVPPSPVARSPAPIPATTTSESESAKPQPRSKTHVPPPPRPPQSQPSRSQVPASASVTTPKRRTSISTTVKKPPPTPRSDRNIDRVVLGDTCFRAWYPSYYPKEVLGDVSGNAATKTNGTGGTAKYGGGKKEKEKEAMLKRLYVCPCCFKYSKEIVAWGEHVRVCEQQGHKPGKKVYTHPQGRRAPNAHDNATPVSTAENSKRKGKGKTADELPVSDSGEWSVWEVDGEKDVLFCQNLSLFAKLFLDNKSVFFDVRGFNYFLLVYTPAPSPDLRAPPRSHITGFFSKEKISWDNNNLACILVFPPWQRKGLGALLMGVSYEISRREGILGGPEKPISELGRKGYKRFWAGEMARWLLTLDLGVDEFLVDIDDCSKATWIAPEDCLAVLRDMAIVEEAGNGSPKGAAVPEGDDDEQSKEVKEVKQVPRVRVDKEAVRRWVKSNKISLDKTCDPDGFIEGYAIPKVEEEEV